MQSWHADESHKILVHVDESHDIKQACKLHVV